MAIGIAFILFPLILAGPVLLIWAIVDLVGRPTEAWQAAGQDRMVWALIVVLVGLIGPILYLTVGRKKLATATTSGLEGIVS